MTLILCYHRINEGVEDPFSLCVSPANFAMHLEQLGQRAEFVTLDEVTLPASRPRVAITFDDGYADNLAHAAPIAQQFEVPMTVYVTSGMVGDPFGFWWDRLAHLIRHGAGQPAEVVVTIGGEPVLTQIGDSRFAGQTIDALRTRLLKCSAEEIEDALGSLAAQLGAGSAAPGDARPLRPDELHQLNGMDHVTIGAHTTRHVQLRNQSLETQVETIVGSKQDLESMMNVPVRHFAYPFGGRDSFDARTVAAVRGAGFETATTTIGGSVGRNPEALRLRRRLVMNWGPRRWRAQMLRWGFL